MTTTNPVSMSVLPTEQCLIGDGANIFTIAGQFTPASSFVDSYQLCDPNSEQCFVASAAGVGATALAIAELERQASQLYRERRYAAAAGAFEKLGLSYSTSGASWNALSAITSYETAARSYLSAGDLVKAADAYSSAARVAENAKMGDATFNNAGLAARTYFEAAKTETTRTAKFDCYIKASQSLKIQERLVRVVDGESAEREALTWEIVIFEMQLEALRGARLNNPPAGVAEYRAGLIESARVSGKLENAYARSGRLGTGEVTATAIKSALGRKMQETYRHHIMVLVAKLERDGNGERTADIVRELGKLHRRELINVADLLDDGGSWLSEALRRVLREDVLPTFKTRVKGVLRVEIK